MTSFDGGALDERFTDYQRAVRDKATDSLHDVKRLFDSPPSVHPSRRRYRTASASQTTSRYREDIEHSDYVYGAAYDSLQSTLRKLEAKHQSAAKTVQFGPRALDARGADVSYTSLSMPSPIQTRDTMMQTNPPLLHLPRGQIPTPEEVVPVLQNQAVYVHQLEAENKYCKDELQAIKMRIKEVIEENRVLHEELKRNMVQEILDEGVDIPGVPVRPPEEATRVTTMPTAGNKPMTSQDYAKWQRELERISALHSAKTNRLEAQLAHAKDEAEKFEKQVDELKSQLRIQESLSTLQQDGTGFDPSLYLQMQTEGAPLTMNQSQIVQRLTRERDELMNTLTTLKARMSELKHREEDAYQQVRKSVEMVENANLERTQVLVQREQLKEELGNMQKRMEEHVEDLHEKMQQERELVRKETKQERDELNSKVKEMNEALVNVQNQLERVSRDKVCLEAELQQARGDLSSFDTEYGKATDSMKMTMTQATIERDKAVTEMARIKSELDADKKNRDQERHRLKTEVDDLRRRLHQAEKELVEAKEECIHLHTTNQALERDAHLSKMAKESIEKGRSDDVKAIMRRADQREEELNMMIDKMENQHSNTSRELEDLISSQASLIVKLREECQRINAQLQDVCVRYKRDNKYLKNQNEQLALRLDRALKRLKEMEDQHTQHGHLHEKMRTRLRQMDNHSQHTSQQVLDLLAKQSTLMRDRQLLGKEVEFLRRQLTTNSDNPIDKLYSSHKGAVDDILQTMQAEDEKRAQEVS